jgi:FAD/FMN-containing dehydrogenase
MADLDLSAFAESLDGEAMAPGDAGYDEARKVYNGMIDKRPAVIARCASTDDVVAAVNLARENDLVVAVRSGGHSVAGMSICDDGILIDLSGLKSIDVDPDAKTATAGGGVLWGEFDPATQEHGLHTPGGRVTTTGVGGFTAGGGYGWTSSKHGLTCDNLISAEVVLADGSVVTASEDENADLFWGLRGGGCNFGVASSFTFRLHELGPNVLAGLALWPISEAERVIPAYRDYVESAPDELSTACVIITGPPEEFVPEELHGQPCLGMAAMYVGDPDEGASVVQPLKDLGPTVDLIGPMPYVGFQAMLDPGNQPGFRNYWKGEYLSGLPDEAIETFIEHAKEPPSPMNQHILFRLGGGLSKLDDDATAFSHRDAQWMFHPIAMWEESSDDERMIAWVREFSDAMSPFATGAAYLNFTPDLDKVRSAYGEEKWERLVELKDKYDPHNLFQHNQNITPSRATGEPALA